MNILNYPERYTYRCRQCGGKCSTEGLVTCKECEIRQYSGRISKNVKQKINYYE